MQKKKKRSYTLCSDTHAVIPDELAGKTAAEAQRCWGNEVWDLAMNEPCIEW